MKCPTCGASAVLIVAVVMADSDFSCRENDWKLTCRCGLDVEGRFPFVHRIVATVLFLVPIAALWALFLQYGQEIHVKWLSFLIFLVHLIGGFLLGRFLSTRYGVVVIGRMVRRGGESG